MVAGLAPTYVLFTLVLGPLWLLGVVLKIVELVRSVSSWVSIHSSSFDFGKRNWLLLMLESDRIESNTA